LNLRHAVRPQESVVSVRYAHTRKHISPAQWICSSFILLALLFGLAQSARAAISHVMKIGVLLSHQNTVQDYYQQALHENRSLRYAISRYTSPDGVEELARNKLQWVGEGEILVRTR
jgi:hypothetical protein